MNKFIRYFHHGKKMSVRKDLKGLHKDYCLCYSCLYFFKDKNDNCSTAQSLFELNKSNGITTPVWECVWFMAEDISEVE